MSARLKCLQTIIGANGVNKPGAEPTLEQLGVKTNEAEVLVRSGAAAWAKSAPASAEPAPAPAGAPAPAQVMLPPAAPEAPAPVAVDETNVVEGELAGVVDADGKVVDLEDMKRGELVEIAEAMDIKTAGMNKQQIVDAIRAERVEIDADAAAPSEDDDAGEA